MATDEELVGKQARFEKIKRLAREQVERERPAPEITVRQAADIPDEKLRTLFGGRLVRGSFQLMVGPGEAGKGFASCDIISRLSTGLSFPGENGTKRGPLTTIVCVTEDSASRVKARLQAAEANLKNVYFVEGPAAMRGGLIVPSPIAFDNDAGVLLKTCQSVGAAALFLETTVEHLGDRENRRQWSTNNEAEVRRALSPIVAVCREGGLIGWGIMHPRKSMDGGIEDSISGSAAFRNVGRSVFNVYRDPTDPDPKSPWRLLLTSKANYLHKRPDTLRFRIEPWERNKDEGKVVWGIEGRTLIDERSAEDIWRQIKEAGQKRRDYTVRDAERILSKFLKNGLQPLEQIRELSEESGLSWRAFQKAKDNLEIESVKEGFPAMVVGWRLPRKDEDM